MIWKRLRTSIIDHNQYERLSFTMGYKTCQNDVLVYKFTIL